MEWEKHKATNDDVAKAARRAPPPSAEAAAATRIFIHWEPVAHKKTRPTTVLS